MTDRFKAAALFVILSLLSFGISRIDSHLSRLFNQNFPILFQLAFGIIGLYYLGSKFVLPFVLGSFLNVVILDSSLAFGLSLIPCQLLSSTVGALLLRMMFRQRVAFEYLSETLAVSVASFFSSILSGSLITFCFFLADAQNFRGAYYIWSNLWVGQGLGCLILIPFLRALVRWGLRKQFKPSLQSISLFFLVLVFGISIVVLGNYNSFMMAIFPAMLLLALRQGDFYLPFASFVFSVAAIVTCSFEGGLFASGPVSERFFHLQIFLAAMAFTNMMLIGLKNAGSLKTPALILLLGWTVSGTVSYSLNRAEENQDLNRLVGLIEKIEGDIQTRFEDYEEALQGAASLLSANQNASSAEWEKFVRSFVRGQKYPELKFLGRLSPQPEAMKKELFNQVAGLEVMGNELIEVSQRALESRKATLATQILFHKASFGESHPGMILLFPVMDQERLISWVYVPLEVKDFFDRSIFQHKSEIELTLYNSVERRNLNHLYSSTSIRQSDFEVERVLIMGQSPFIAKWKRGPHFLGFHSSTSDWICLVGTVFSLLVASTIMNIQLTREQAEKIAANLTREFRRSEDRFRSLAGLAPIGICQFDENLKCTYSNSAWKDLSGQTITDSSGYGWMKSLHDRDKEVLSGLWSEFSQSYNDELTLRFRLIEESKLVRWAFCKMIKMRDQKDQVLGYIACIQDITKQKINDDLMTMQNLVSRYLLSASHGDDFYSGILSLVGQSMEWLQGAFWSQEGLDPQKIEARATWVAHPDFPRMGLKLEYVQRAMSAARPFVEKHGETLRLYIPIRSRDQNWGVMEFILRNDLSFEDEALSVFQSLAIRISDFLTQRRSEEIIRKREAKFIEASKMASLGEMAGGIAHEINNPLAIIKGKSYILEMMAKSGKIEIETILQQARGISETVNRIARIVKGLRSFARNVENDPMDKTFLKNLVDNTMELCQERFRNNGVDLRLSEIPEIEFESRETEISQVLLNILGNAYDAVVGLSQEKWVRLEIFQEDQEIVFSVTDSGPGIPPEVAQKMMQPFFTTKEIGKGTGLGLSISKGIIESHGGRLYLDSSSQNTRFIFRLPLSQNQVLS